ncbi:MAG TPA: M20/M25/M40 family metallo-hydrolase [Roseiflexaceae bacterium]|nr:M20/M25/M40 family metallo-hydrolase [Roseiflexaceae bacterium]
MLYRRPVELLQRLIRFDTSNPPGNEVACTAFVRELLHEAGLDPLTLALDPARPNVVARLPGRGAAPPLLLQGHLDVVGVAGQEWRHPPFEGRLAEGFVWGRGALDMKGGVAMLLAAFLRAAAEGPQPPGDVILALMSDEEAGSVYGARFLVERHAGLFAGVRYALGEFGGFTVYRAGRRFYPIMVAEKQSCHIRATVRGPGGHGASIVPGTAAARLGRLLTALDRTRLPIHVTPVVRRMLEDILAALPLHQRIPFSQVLNPALAGRVLRLLGPQGQIIETLLRNTVTPTIVRAGGPAINVIPAEATVELDVRLLPGFTPADALAELRPLLGEDVELEVLAFEAGPTLVDMGLFGTLAGILREADPAGLPTPLMVHGVTDARFFSRLGIQTYGFLPMQLPPDFSFWNTLHAADERIPAEAVGFGAEAIYRALQRFAV